MSEWISYYSHGNCLVIADYSSNWQTLLACPWPARVNPHILLRCERDREGFRLIHKEQRVQVWVGFPLKEIRGYLGEFKVISWKGQNLAHLMGVSTQRFDLILDVGVSPILKQEVPPLGYFFVSADSDLSSVVAGLAEWVGTFDKPKYFSYREQICAHAVSRYDGCTSCLTACAAEAITSEKRRIQVNPYLCQGCGDCTSVCPSGAINYIYPTRDRFLSKLRECLISAQADLDFKRGIVVLVHENTQADVVKAFCEQQGDKVLLLAVEALGAVGPDAWLAALAYGASAVWLLANGILNHTRSNLQAQMQWVRAILAALGYNPQAVSWVHVDQGNIEWLAQPGIPSAAFWPLADKREVLRLALFHLTCHASFKPAEIPLPEGSPLGAIEVDSGSCTLCMACAYVCPVKALRVEGDKPQLKFVEINCVQCGLCKHACPEKAIRLKPRFLTDWDELRQARILHEEVPFNCLGCGRPFATAKMIGVILARMSTHSMFAFEHQRRRLMLCEECRIRDITMAEDNGD